jgi:hypothetical protein
MSQEGVEALTSMGTSKKLYIQPSFHLMINIVVTKEKKNKFILNFTHYYDIISNDILYQTHNYKHLLTNCPPITYLPTY